VFKRSEGLASIRAMVDQAPCLVTVGMTWVDWNRIRPSDGNLALKTLGSGSSIGLGLALALPQQRIVVLDGDGAVLMNVNGLVTLGRLRPKNLIQIVFDNKMYECSGRVPTATAYGTDLVVMAKGAGIRNAAAVDALPAFTEAVQWAFATDGPHFIVAEVSPSNENVITYPRWLDDADNRYRFMRYIEALAGRKLHEDAIDVKLSLS
jgi:thiamine pyrophosphate-dependent acetolactate synthase large subunit-like protein